MALGDAQRILNTIRQAVGQETKTGAQIEFLLGVVAVNNGNYVDLYLDGNVDTASQNFRVPAGVALNVNDPVLAAIDYGSRLGKWIVQVIPLTDYSKVAINANSGTIVTGDGTVAPSTPLRAGRTFPFFVGG